MDITSLSTKLNQLAICNNACISFEFSVFSNNDDEAVMIPSANGPLSYHCLQI